MFVKCVIFFLSRARLKQTMFKKRTLFNRTRQYYFFYFFIFIFFLVVRSYCENV